MKKQNIWELILKVDGETINSVNVRQGQNKPDSNSKNILKYGREKELSCGKDIERIILEQNQAPKHRQIIAQGQRIPQNPIQEQVQVQELEPESKPKGFFGKIKNFFTRKRGGKYTFKYKNKNKNKKNKKYNSKKNTSK